MKKIFILGITFILFVTTSVFTKANGNQIKKETTLQQKINKDFIIKNKLFSISIPEEMKKTFETKISKDRICIYDKASKKAGFGGFAFGIKAYENPADHAVLPGSRKIGELTDKKGILYDIVLKHPTDVQYDYTKGPEAPESFKRLYNLGESVNIQGINGSAYYEDQGMKGQDLYKEILQKYVDKISAKPNSDELEKEEMSYMYNVLAQSGGNVLDKVGYAYYDINADGIDELMIGEIAQGEWKGVIYDMYTMVNRKPKHVLSGGARNRYFVCDDVFLCNEYSSGANESGVIVYALLENSTEIYPQVSFKYDAYTNPKNPWFISYGSELNDDKWNNVSEETFNDRKEIFDKYQRFDFTPLSKLK